MSLQQLKRTTETDVLRSSRSPPTNIDVYAKVVNIQDGDTCDLVFFRNGVMQRYECRLLGINTPELGTGPDALKSRDFLAWLCLGNNPDSFPRQKGPWSDAMLQNLLNSNQNLVYVEFRCVGYYGRPLVTLMDFSGTKSFNQLLLNNGYARIYY